MPFDVRQWRCVKTFLLVFIIISIHAVGLDSHSEASPEDNELSPHMCLNDDGLRRCVQGYVASDDAPLEDDVASDDGRLEDDVSFLQLQATVGGHTPSSLDKKMVPISGVATTKRSGLTADVEEDGRLVLAVGRPVPAPPAAPLAPAALTAPVSARSFLSYADFVAGLTSSWNRMHLSSASSPAASICFAIIVFSLAVVLVFMTCKTNLGGSGSQRELQPVPSSSLLQPVDQARLSNVGARTSYTSSGTTPTAHRSPPSAFSKFQPALPSALSQRLSSAALPPVRHSFPAPVSSPPQPLDTLARHLSTPDTLASSRPSHINAQDIPITLKLPLIIHDEIPIAGTMFKVTDDSGAEKFAVKVWPPNSFMSSGIPQHRDVCEFLQVFSSSAGRLQELFLCAICGRGGKFACYVYRAGVVYGTIAADLTFPTAEYVKGSPYTLKTSDNRRLMTILRREEHGMQVLSGQAKITADVKERVQEDLYECVCQAGADAGQVLLMVLGMDRLDDHISRNS